MAKFWSVWVWWTLLASHWWMPEPLLHHKGSQAPKGGSWPWCTLRLLLSGLRPSTGTEYKSVSVWWTSLASTWWFTENLPHKTHVLPDALLVTEPNRQPEGRRESQSAVGLPELPLGLVLVEAYLDGQLGHSHAHPDLAEAAKTIDHFVTPNM